MLAVVHLDRNGFIAVLTLDSPPENFITPAMLADLGEHIRCVSDDPAVRAVVLRGAGTRHFTAGVDARHLAAMAGTVTGLDRAIEASPKIFICAMKGYDRDTCENLP
jgi:enoyl-CoA hydratase/carnithine racemase